MMKGFKVAVTLGLFLCAISSAVHGVSVSCMMAYDEGGVPAVFQSPECLKWLLLVEAHQNQTDNCQFATLQGHREYQEDFVTCNLDMKIPIPGKYGPEKVTVGLAAVFDGHGGKEASEMASKSLLDYFFLHVLFNTYKQTLPYKEEHDMVSQGHSDEPAHHVLNLSSQEALPVVDNESLHCILKEALLRTINDIDSKFSKEAFSNHYVSGSTATVVLLLDGQILVAFVGDSKALLCSENIQSRLDAEGTSVTELYAQELTRDHHPDRADERARIEAAGGFIQKRGVPRVNGILALSRSIGDVYFKRYGLIAVPEVLGWLSLTTSDIYLVIASDGIFESLTPQDVCSILGNARTQGNEMAKNSSSCSASSSLADCVVSAALTEGSTDNLSAIVVPLRPAGSSQEYLDEL
ncbi:unnamed protein product [Ilex paraguariensis]|uniref:protein-serine/threonine phosphatase n=1 Tax=Ilex paraguariensis TaxID=185542 RepID=A0ABC8RHS9_9AQUA